VFVHDEVGQQFVLRSVSLRRGLAVAGETPTSDCDWVISSRDSSTGKSVLTLPKARDWKAMASRGVIKRLVVCAAVAISSTLVAPVAAMAVEVQVDSWDALEVAVDGFAAGLEENSVEETIALVNAIPAGELERRSGAALTGEVASWSLPSGEDLVVARTHDVLGLSSLALRLDGNDVVHTGETYAELLDSGEVQLRQWADGDLVGTTTFKATGRNQVRTTTVQLATGVPISTTTTENVGSSKGLSFSSAGNGATTNATWHAFSTSRFFSCTDKAGVAGWVIGAFFAICGASGIVTAGTALVACALGIAGTGGALGACVAYATYW